MPTLEIQKKVEQMLVQSGAWLKGHFKLTSGKHSGNYMQCAMLLRFPEYATYAGSQLAEQLRDLKPDFIVSPALGGLIIGHEVARALKVPFLFCEREEGKMRLRRFPMPEGKTFIVVEDVVTTGGSTKETAEHMVQGGCQWLGSACIVDRSGGKCLLPSKPFSLLEVNFPVYDPGHCPLCRELGTEPIKPGSRNI